MSGSTNATATIGRILGARPALGAFWITLVLTYGASCSPAFADGGKSLGEKTSNAPDELVLKAEETLRGAARFFRERVAIEGSYVWRVSADMTFRQGKAKTTATQGWAQPPGTPAVGLAYVDAYQATGERYYLEAAREAALALVKTQLISGGWNEVMEFDAEAEKAWCYRRLMARCNEKGPRKENHGRNAADLDDDVSQSATRLLIAVDALDHHPASGSNPAIGEAARYALDRLVQAQYPNGAWPIRLDRRVQDQALEAKVGAEARYPLAWSRRFTDVPSPEFFVLNDHLIENVIRTLLLGHRHYGDGRLLQAALRAGDFLLAAQMPAPQRGWAHVYSSEMEPIWGRPFEPPALASWETASTISALLDLYRYTGFKRYLSAIEPAAEWLENATIGDERWSRFYELETNRPLYVTSEYKLTYEDDDLPGHYGFQDRFDIPEVLEAYRTTLARSPAEANGKADTDPLDDALFARVEAIIDSLDDQGRWLEGDMLFSKTFVDNVRTLSRFIAAARGRALTVTRLGV